MFLPSEPSSGRTISLEIAEEWNSYILRLLEVTMLYSTTFR
jgi:hypothetical protein